MISPIANDAAVWSGRFQTWFRFRKPPARTQSSSFRPVWLMAPLTSAIDRRLWKKMRVHLVLIKKHFFRCWKKGSALFLHGFWRDQCLLGAVASKPNPNSKPNFYRPFFVSFSTPLQSAHRHTHVDSTQKLGDKSRETKKVRIHEIFKYSGQIRSNSNSVMVSENNRPESAAHMAGAISVL